VHPCFASIKIHVRREFSLELPAPFWWPASTKHKEIVFTWVYACKWNHTVNTRWSKVHRSSEEVAMFQTAFQVTETLNQLILFGSWWLFFKKGNMHPKSADRHRQRESFKQLSESLSLCCEAHLCCSKLDLYVTLRPLTKNRDCRILNNTTDHTKCPPCIKQCDGRVLTETNRPGSNVSSPQCANLVTCSEPASKKHAL